MVARFGGHQREKRKRMDNNYNQTRKYNHNNFTKEFKILEVIDTRQQENKLMINNQRQVEKK